MSNKLADRRVSTCNVERGLYVLRYADSPCEPCPTAAIKLQGGSVELLGAPGQEQATLRHPGQAIVLAAHTRAVFDLEVTAARRGSGADASFALDLIASASGDSQSEAGASRDRPVDTQGADDGPEIDVLAHVSRRGDVSARAGEWIAGPGMVLPIEGLSIMLDRRDLGVDIQVQTERGLGHWSQWCRDGEFAGTRQRAESLTGIGLALRGDRAADYLLSAEVMHLGSGVQLREGRQVEFIGVDPIVGFRLRLKRVILSDDGNHPLRSGLRVFRARQQTSIGSK